MNDALLFRDLLDQAILSGRSSADIAREFGVRSETVRKRRKMLRYCGLTANQNIEALDARRNRRPRK